MYIQSSNSLLKCGILPAILALISVARVDTYDVFLSSSINLHDRLGFVANSNDFSHTLALLVQVRRGLSCQYSIPPLIGLLPQRRNDSIQAQSLVSFSLK